MNINKYTMLDRYITTYSEKPGGLVRVLQKAQEIFGYLSPEVQVYVARKMNMAVSVVTGVATFYAQFSVTPQGDNIINVCLGTACYVKKGNEVFESFKKHLRIDADGTTPDNKFTLRSTRCIGACSIAPVVTINEDVYSQISTGQVVAILDRYRKGAIKDAPEHAARLEEPAAANPPPP